MDVKQSIGRLVVVQVADRFRDLSPLIEGKIIDYPAWGLILRRLRGRLRPRIWNQVRLAASQGLRELDGR